MRLNQILLSLVLVMFSCSSSNQKEQKIETELKESEYVPFEQLVIVRVMPSFITHQVDQKQLRQTMIEEFEKIGVVHTPDTTSLEKMLAAQTKPFAIMTIEIKEITTEDFNKTFPIIALFCRMYEEGVFLLNKKHWMGNVWEKIYYVEMQKDQNLTTEAMKKTISNLACEFSKNYREVNSKTVKPVFYIGRNME